jgi:hypothetical protein
VATTENVSHPPDLWIAESHSLKGAPGERAWEDRRGVPRNSNRLIELADIALGLKEPSQRKKKASPRHPSDEPKD